MLKIFKRINDLFETSSCLSKELVLNELKVEYKNIPPDILEWFFIRHVADGNKIMNSINNVDASKIMVKKIKLNNEDLCNKKLLIMLLLLIMKNPILYQMKN